MEITKTTTIELDNVEAEVLKEVLGSTSSSNVTRLFDDKALADDANEIIQKLFRRLKND